MRWLLPCVYFWRCCFLDFLEDIPFLGPLIGGIGDYFSGKQTNEANAEQAALNREFQERMSSTSYQRATADMSVAGLNPMLAYQQGGASSPGGSTATMQNPMSSAIHSAASIANTKAQTELTNAQRDKVRAETPGAEATSARLQKELLELVPEQIRTAQLERDIRDAEAYFRQFEKNTAMSNKETSRAVFEYYMAKFKQLPVHVRNEMAQATLRELDIPEARAEANVWRSEYGKKVRPYVRDAANVTQSASQIRRLFRGGM